MKKENEIETKGIQSKANDLEYKKIKMRCLECAVSLRVSGDPELIESKAAHFYNGVLNGEKK